MKCRICKYPGGGKRFTAREMFFGIRSEHDYYMCPVCECLQIVDIPSDMDRYYNASYYSMRKEEDSLLRRILLSLRNRYIIWGKGLLGKLLFQMFPTELYLFLEPLKNIITVDSSILDVGCGSGKLLLGLKRAGFKRLLGIDPFIGEDIFDGGRILVKKQSIFDLSEKDDEFDLVMFHHSLEHIYNPADVLLQTAKMLSQGGICVVRVPLVSSFAWQKYGVNWVQLDAPRHFYLHTPKSISILAETTGFNLGPVLFDSTSFQFWGSEQYLRGIPLMDERSYAVNPRKSIFSKDDISAFEKRAHELNSKKRGDQAIFYLYKRS